MNWFKRKPKAVVAPWDGKHLLVRARFVEEFGTGMGDYYNGWAWKCTCGAGTPGLATRWTFTEAQAVAEFNTHRDLYEPAP